MNRPNLNARNLALLLACLLSILLPGGASAQPAGAGPVVSLPAGALRGYLDGDIGVFRAIPYAAPPIGDLRWRPPAPAAAWKGERDSTHLAAACVQRADGLTPFIRPMAAAYGVGFADQTVPFSEDCLYLNVWMPRGNLQNALPVMVWLHGGSNTAGSASQPTYDATSLASHGVIVVTVNYRLGIFGFFSHPGLTAESPQHSSGNYGLLDQLAALRWVQANIAFFGGDPNNVTLFGESAGSIDAGDLMTSPLSTGLFHRVILESGPPFGLGPSPTLHDAEAAGVAIAASSASIASLRQVSAAELMRIANAHGPYAVPMIVDGWVLPQTPAKAFASGAAQKVDLMVGLNGRELSAFRLMAAEAAKQSPKPQASGSVVAMLKGLADTARPLYGGWTYIAISKYIQDSLLQRDRAIDQASNDMLMSCPIGALATLTAANGPHVYVYRFDRSIPGKGESTLGAFHGIEIPYVFNKLNEHSWQWLPFTDVDRDLSKTIEIYWTNFAKTGDPNGAGVQAWSAWKEKSEDYMRFSPQGLPEARTGFSPPFCYLSLDRVRSGLTSQGQGKAAE